MAKRSSSARRVGQVPLFHQSSVSYNLSLLQERLGVSLLMTACSFHAKIITRRGKSPVTRQVCQQKLDAMREG
ncbi:hypothetical protein ACOY6I_22935, partial [Enterobacter hormaechei]